VSSEDVAIIGAAMLLPGTDGEDGIRALHELLKRGQDAVGQPGAERLHNCGGTPGTRYVPMGYLDRIDQFDHAFFGISLREAEFMDPHQRLILQLAHHAIESSGHAPRELRGSRTAVILGYARSDYDTLFEDDDSQQLLGSIGASLAARISYLFDFTGPALVTDTACSGSLTAVAQAVRSLRAGEADLALAGGISLRSVLLPQQGHVPMRGIESTDGRCRPFDEQATGAVAGEGGGIVALRLLRDALAAGDTVQAVIKGVAVNHNGYRMASMSAPSQLAQTEVIRQAWLDAGIEAKSVGYVECHGSATPLGDVVEVDALRRAFLDAGVTDSSCAIGSVKGNFGHLDSAAGIAGLLKVIASVRYDTLYPTAHFREPNPLIDFSGPVQVNPAERPWPPEAGTPRLAGLSSLGLTGTNVHAVISEASVPPSSSLGPAERGGELVTVSAKSASALRRYRDRLADFAEHTGHGLRVIAHAMNRGRDDYPFRLAVPAGTKEELASALRSAAVPDVPAADAPPVVLLFSGDGEIGEADWAELDPGPPPDGPAARLVAAQFALYRLARSLGLPDTHVVGSGAGNLTVRLARGAMSLSDGLRAAADLSISTEVDERRLAGAVQGFVRDGAVLVEMGTGGVLSRMIRRLAPELACVEFLGGGGRRGVLRALASLYRLGVTLDWDRYYEGEAIPRIEAPTYPFDPIRCWCRPAGVPADPAAVIDERPRPEPATSAEAERRVAEVWANVLGARDVGPGTDYFALGGTSIAGMSMLRTLERDFGVQLTFADMYGYPTVRAFAGRVTELRSSSPAGALRSIEPIPRGDRLPVSFGQEQLWYLDRLNPDSALYNIPHDLRLRGPLDHAALAGAVRDLVARHEILRTCIRDEDGVPFVRVRSAEPDLPVIDLSRLSEVDIDRAARRIVHEESVRPFDLAEGPLARVTLVRLGEDDHILLWIYHHIIFDGWSPSLFFRDFTELYQARVAGREPDLAPLTLQFADFAAWQRERLAGEELKRGLDFWRTELAGLERPELPLDRPRPPVQTFAGDMLEFTLDAALADRVRRFSKRNSVTTFVTMLAVVDALLYRWAGLTDVIIGVGTSGRMHPETHDLIGYFNNLPPFRTRVTGDLTFTDLLRRCASTAAGALDHEEIPLERIVAELCERRDPDRHPLFDVVYTYQNVPQDTAELGGLRCTRYLDGAIAGIAPGTAKFDLTVGIVDQQEGPLDGYLEYAVALYDRDTMERLAGWLPALLDSALRDPDRSLDDLAASTSDDESPADPVRLFEEWAARRPDHPAVCGAGGETVSYRELNRRANRVARRLIEAGVGPDVAVPVVASRGPGLVTGWLAVTKAGGAYVPIDTSAPTARIDDLLAEVGASIVLTDENLAVEATGEADDENPPFLGGPGNLAYITYTSGSTGRPQGCELERRNLANFVRWYRNVAAITKEDRSLQAVSPGFDAAVLEIWGALASGATVCFIPSLLTDPGRLLRWLTENRVTVGFLPAPLVEVIFSEGQWPDGLRLRVLCSGACQLRYRPPVGAPFRVLNVYGPTECTVASTVGWVDAAPPDSVPDIGRPVAGTAVYLLDPSGEYVNSGQWGELYIGGAAVGRGYHRNPGLTAARFVADPFAGRPGARMYRTGDLARWRPDGMLEFGGRLDDQLEIRGHRVEPVEIERTLTAHPLVREAMVVGTTASSGSTRLVAYVAGDAPDGGELITWTAQRLPEYMVPAEVVVRDSLPRTPNGKLDRRSLRTMPLVSSTVDGQGRSHAERVLTGICTELLAVDSVSPNDNFFTLGGDSILGVRVAARAAKAGVHFTPQQLLQCHTVGELAKIAAVVSEPDTTAAPVERGPNLSAPDRPIPLTPIMHSFLRRMPDGAKDFVDVQTLETTPGVGVDAVRAAVGHLLTLHEPLRYRFPRNGLGTRIECGEVDPARLVDTKVLPPMSTEEELEVITDDCRAIQAEMNPERGPVLRVRHYDRGRTRSALIVLLINHFVFDNMSTVVLLDDLDTLLADLLAGRSPALSPRPPRWREWSEHLRDMASSDELAAELTYWTATLKAGAATGTLGETGERTLHVADRTLAPGHVAEVLTAGAAEGREAALCAAACGLARWRGTPNAYLMTEGEATPNPFRLAGRGPSVGWFTTLHPLVLPVEPGTTARHCLPGAVDRIRSVPNDGVGYGILRHLSPESPAVARLRSLPEPGVLALHGPSDTSGLDLGVRLLRTRWDLSVNLKDAVTFWFALIIATAVRDGALQIVVSSTAGLGPHRLEPLADEVARAFAELTAT
jgi:amino acid adenylation domain-containing protein